MAKPFPRFALSFLLLLVCASQSLPSPRPAPAPPTPRFMTAAYLCRKCYSLHYGAFVQVHSPLTPAEWNQLMALPPVVYHLCQTGSGAVMLGRCELTGFDLTFVAPISNDPNAQPQFLYDDPAEVRP